MNDHDERLRQQVREAWRRKEPASIPSFADTWQRAEMQTAAARRRYIGVAAATAVLATIVLVFGIQRPADEPTYIGVADLLESTYWSAPSDVLIPEREFDIYQELPALFETT